MARARERERKKKRPEMAIYASVKFKTDLRGVSRIFKYYEEIK
jgi:hypothetical protein